MIDNEGLDIDGDIRPVYLLFAFGCHGCCRVSREDLRLGLGRRRSQVMGGGGGVVRL